jgi:GNAT superfamily N-acetyltransferase
VVVVRPVERADIPAAARVLQGGSFSPDDEHPDDVDAYWRAVIVTRSRRGDVLVAQLGEEVVGVCQVMVFPHFQRMGGWCCELESVHVRSDVRSQGIGTLLLRRAEELARSEGCYRIQLTSRNVRDDAHRFYRNNGFDQTSQGFKKSLVG